MIVRHEGDELIVVTQMDHADLSYQLSTHWGNSEFDRPEPNLGMIQSSGTHDDGWKRWDENPLLDPRTMRPFDFYQLPMEHELKIHQDTIESVREGDPYARLMVSMHRSGLCYERYGTEKGWEIRAAKKDLKPEVKEFADSEEAWQQQIKRTMAKEDKYRVYIDESHVWTNYKLLEVFDRLSLFACWNKSKDRLGPTPTKYGEKDIELALDRPDLRSVIVEPWPFDSKGFTIYLRTYVLKDREYRDSAELARELYSVPDSKVILDIEVRKKTHST